MEWKHRQRKINGAAFIGVGLFMFGAIASNMSGGYVAVRSATPHPATLVSVSEPECSTAPKNTTCKLAAVARIKSPSGMSEQPVFAGSYPSRHETHSARAAHMIGAPTKVYRLALPRDDHRYYTAPAFEQLREASTLRGNALALFGASLLIFIGAISLALGFIGAARQRASE